MDPRLREELKEQVRIANEAVNKMWAISGQMPDDKYGLGLETCLSHIDSEIQDIITDIIEQCPYCGDPTFTCECDQMMVPEITCPICKEAK